MEIGIEFGKRQFYWIAAKSLQDPLPDEWQEFEADEGDLPYLTLLDPNQINLSIQKQRQASVPQLTLTYPNPSDSLD